MNTISQVEAANRAPTPVESGDTLEASNEDVCNGREELNDSYNGSTPSRSRYGRMIKPKPSMDDVVSPLQNVKLPKTRKQQNSINNSSESIDKINSTDEATGSSIISNSTEEESSSIIQNPNPIVGCQWALGQLAWAKVGNFPYWPCVITLDPDSMIYYKWKTSIRCSILMIHVQYFGDNERHSWVSANNMMQFTSLADFLKLSDSLTTEAKKKDTKYAAFIVKPGIKSKWENAIDEAMQVQPMTMEERAEVFAPKIKVSKQAKSSTADDKNKNNKRKYSTDQDGPDTKRAKHDNVNNTEKSEVSKLRKSEVSKSKNSRTVNGKIDLKLNSDSLPSSPLSHKSSNDNTSTKVDKTEEDEDGVFEIYYERNRDLLVDEYPNASEKDIKKYLRKTWDSMDTAFRKKYRSYMTRDSSHSKDSTPDREDLETSAVETDTSPKESSPKENKKRTKVDKEESSISETKRGRPYNLFKGMKQEKVCQICEKTGKLTRCKGPCYSYFHLSCVKPGESSPEHSVDESTSDDRILDDLNIIKKSMNNEHENNDKNEEQEDETFKCIDCLSGVAPACFICNEREEDRIRCTVIACGKHYHSKCLNSWPQSYWQGGRLTCPYHVCHTCSSDNPQDSYSRASNEKIVRCVRCPSTYHASALCLPAGSLILTGSQIVCPKHYKAQAPPLNAAWCFLCTRGGSLICCDTCPTSFHVECLGIDAPDGGFICEDCETGRLPLYGEVVWVKLGHYRWWPSRICYPQEIPENIEPITHIPGKFCVMFLGSNNYYWVDRGRVFLYQDGDANIKSMNKKTTNIKPMNKKTMKDSYLVALREANKIHQQLKTERSMTTKEPKLIKPPPYVKLKVNKPVGNVKPAEVDSIVACDCDPNWDKPCAPGTDCLNRILLVECSPEICPAGNKCMNQSFVLRQYPAMEPFHTVGRGWGLKALEDIKAGQFVIEYVGEVIDEAEYKRRLHQKKEIKNENFYFLTIDNNRTIDAEPKGNLSRFMNHSCAPNCETQKWTVNGDTRIGLFALRDIESGEELTFNYNLASDGETRKVCLCGASNCSGFIGLKAQRKKSHKLKQQQVETKCNKKIHFLQDGDANIKPPINQDDDANIKPPINQDGDANLKSPINNKRRDATASLDECWDSNECRQCGQEISDLNNSIFCLQKHCNKKYHATCVENVGAQSKFSCPLHFCKECKRKTSAHCSFCTTAFCPYHLNGNLFELRNGEKNSFVCKVHENEAQKFIKDEKEYSDNDNETDKEYLSTSSDSSIVMEKITTREPSPGVTIIEVQLNSEESEESQKEEEESNLETNFMSCNTNSRKKKTFYESQQEENQAMELSNLTSNQLEAIIGGSLC